MHPQPRCYLSHLVALAACLLAPALAAATVTYDTQYLSGQAVPGGGPFDFSTFSSIGNGSINADGEIAFIADVSRPEQIGQPFVTRGEILSEGAGTIGNPAQVVRAGDPVTNAPAGVTYLQFDSITITNAGNVGFMGRRSDHPASLANDLDVPFGGESFFMTSPSAPASAQLIATATDEPVAFLGGNTIKSIFPVTRYDNQGGFSGSFGVTSGLVGDSPPRVEVTSFGILAGDANGFTRQVPSDDFRNNYAAQNNGDTLLPVPFAATSFGFNDRGEHAFSAAIQPEGLFIPVNTVLSEAAGSIGNPQIVASSNDPIPEISQDALISGFGRISLNNAGQHAYTVSYQSAIPGNFASNAILSESRGAPGAPGLVYGEGDRVSDLLPDSRFGPLTPSLDLTQFGSSRMEIGDGGHVVFRATTVPEPREEEGEDDRTAAERERFEGLWVRGPGAQDDVQPVHLLRRTSDQSLILGDMGPLIFERSFMDIDINARGQVAFLVDFSDTAPLNGGPITPIGETIYATDLSGVAQIIARSGELFDVSDDPNAPDLRTLDRVTLDGFTDFGELLFNATFTDGSSGLFTAGVDAIDRIPGDFNFSGDVDGADFLTWQRDPDVGNLADWQAAYGVSTGSLAGSSAAVPEPSGLLLGILAASLWSCSRPAVPRS